MENIQTGTCAHTYSIYVHTCTAYVHHISLVVIPGKVVASDEERGKESSHGL